MWFILPCKAAGTERVNFFMREVYGNDVLLSREKGCAMATALQDFVRAYMFEAHTAYGLGLSHFPLHPKLHALHHIAHEIFRSGNFRLCSQPWGFCMPHGRGFHRANCNNQPLH